MSKLAEQNQLTLDKVAELAAHTGAYLIRTRHQQNQGISNDEIEGVLQTLVTYLETTFEGQWEKAELVGIRNQVLELLKSPTFDATIQAYFMPYYQ